MHKLQQILGASALLVFGLQQAQAAAFSYTYDQPTSCGSWCYNDPGNTKLIDGVYGNAGWAYNYGAEWDGWVGVPAVNITFQLGQMMTVSSVSVGSTQDNLGDVVLPSLDLWAYQGGSWVLKGTITNPPDNANNHGAYDGGPHPIFTFNGLNVATDQLRITATPGVPGTWIFIDEVGIMMAPVPEPSSWAMLLAGLGLLGYARRTRAAVRTTRLRR